MANYRKRDDGLFDVETSAGYMPIYSSNSELRQLGYTPEDLNPPIPVDATAQLSPADDFSRFAGQAVGASRELPDHIRLPTTAEQGIESKKAHDAAAGATGRRSRFSPRTAEMNLDGAATEGAAPAATPQRQRVIPAIDMKSSWTVKPGYETPGELAFEEEFIANERRNQIAERGDRQAQQADQALDVTDRAIGQQERAVTEADIRLRKLRDDYERRQSEIDREREAVDKLEVDPDRVFSDNGGTFAKVIAGISIIAGGILMGLQGRQSNPGLDAVNDAIDRNVREQKEKIARRRQGIAERETELERLVKVYGSPELAERELRERQMALASAYARRVTQDSPDDVRANVEMALTDHDAARLQRRIEIDRAAEAETLEQWRHMPSQVTGGGPAKDGEVQQYASALQKEGIPQAEATIGSILDIANAVPEGVDIPTAASRNVASRAARGVLDFVGGSGTGSEVLDNERERNAAGQLNRAKAQIRKELSGASLTPQEQASFEEQMSTVNDKAGLVRFARDLQRSVARKKDAIGAGFAPPVLQTYEGRRGAYAPKQRPQSTQTEK